MAKTLELNGWGELVQLRHGALADGGGKLFVDEARWWEKRHSSTGHSAGAFSFGARAARAVCKKSTDIT